MYFNIFSLFNYSKREVDDTIDCFICFMPYEPNNPIKMLSEFSHIIQKCKCNTNIHLLCLNNWIQKTQSCPICRTKFIQTKQSKSINYIVCIINIYVFIILFYNLFICIFIFKHILFNIYLFIKL
jgi:hypothetical protein